jgi:acid ceramidase
MLSFPIYPTRYIGVITGIRPGVFSISMNERYGLRGGYIGLIEWIFNINRKQSFVTFAMRDMLTTAQTYDQAVEYLAEVKLTAPCYYILAGPQTGQVRRSLVRRYPRAYYSCSR